MDDESRGLVDDEQVGVLVDDADVDLRAGLRSSGEASGTTRRRGVPAPTTALALSGTPSDVRCPAEMSFWTWLRDRPVTSAR